MLYAYFGAGRLRELRKLRGVSELRELRKLRGLKGDDKRNI